MAVYTVIIPNRDKPELLNLTLSTLIADKSFLNANYEIIVANDGGSEIIEKEIIKYRDNKINILNVNISPSRGSYFARNQAIKVSSGKWLIFFDSGLRISEKWFCKLQYYMAKCEYIAGNVKIEMKEKMTLGEKFDYIYAFPIKEYLIKYHFGGAGYLIVAKEVFNKIGVFNENLYSGGDGEFGVRVYNAGFTQCFFPNAPAFHPPRNFKQQFFKKIRQIKGHYDIYTMNNYGRNPMKFNYLIKILIPFKQTINEIKRYKANKDKYALVPFYQLIIGSFIYYSINSFACIYVRFNKKKFINT